MIRWNHCVVLLLFSQITVFMSSPIKDVKADRRLLAAILGYRKEDIGFINEVIRVHNKYRNIHGCRELSQCGRLRQQAGMYAQNLANQGVQAPLNDPKLEFGIGENIYISCGNEVSAEEAVNHWYNEVCNYFPNKRSYDEYKHFAQVVWKTTYLIGVGRRTTTTTGQKCTYVVTRYRPGAEQGPAESINIPKGNFDASTCSGKVTSGGGTVTNTQASEGLATQPGNGGSSESGRQPAIYAGRGLQGSLAGGGRVPVSASSQPPGSSQLPGLPAGSQPESVLTETSEGGGMPGNGGTTEGNYVPGVKPTSVPGTGDRERATNPENSHISPLIEQHETGSVESLPGTIGQPVSPTPDTPTSNKKGKPDKPASSTEGNPDNPANEAGEQVNQAKPVETGKPAGSTEDNPVTAENPTNQANNPNGAENPNEQLVNQASQANPVQPSRPTEQPNDPAQSPEDVSSGSVKQCPPCPSSNTEKLQEPQGSQGSQPQSTEASKSLPSGNEVSQGQSSGTNVLPGVGGGREVSESQPSEGSNAATSEVKPSNEGRLEGNVASPESAGVAGGTNPSENTPESQGGREGGGNKLGPQGVSEGNTGSSGGNDPSVNQPTRENQSVEAGNSGSTDERTGMTSGGGQGSPGSTGVTSGGTAGSQGQSSGGPEGSQGVTGPEGQSQSASNPERTGTTQGEGSRTGLGESGTNGIGGEQGGQTGATQGVSERGGKPDSISEGGAFFEDLGIFQKSALEAHNKYRKFHNSPPLVQNSEMSAQATEFAKTLAKSSINDAEHSLKSSRDNQGENIYAACGTDPSGTYVTKEWYKELCNYSYNKNAEIDVTKPIGHFTQIIWKSSTEFGIGRAYGSKQDCVYIVARYKPPGNIIGSESANIARGTMDAEYCGREFMAINKPGNGTKEKLVPPNQSTNEAAPQESGNINNQGQNGQAGNSETSPSEASNVNQEIQQNGESSNTGTSQSETSSLPGNPGNTNSVTNEATPSDFTRDSREGSRTNGMNKQSQMNPIARRDSNKGIRTPFLPDYLQNSVLENTNKRYKGLRTE